LQLAPHHVRVGFQSPAAPIQPRFARIWPAVSIVGSTTGNSRRSPMLIDVVSHHVRRRCSAFG
jgi:hypothetical protein